MPKKKKKSKKLKYPKALVQGVVVGILIALIAFIIVIGWGIYKLDWQNNFTNTVTQIIPYPAARVDTSVVLYKDYVKSLETAQRFFTRQQEYGLPEMPSDEEIKEFALQRLVEDIYVKKVARQFNVNISQDEVLAQIDKIIANKGSQEELVKFLAEYYDLSIEEYQELFTKPDLLYDKTNQAIINDEALNGQLRKVMEIALTELNSGAKYEDVVEKYSVASNAKQGGLLGDFYRGELPKDLEDRLYILEEGDYTDIVFLENSLQIIKVEKKDYEQGLLTLKTIAVKIVSVDDLIAQEKQNADAKIYVY
ncbi:SurA N-terminal domain-containing protein [Patescibacteria group bacterium]